MSTSDGIVFDPLRDKSYRLTRLGGDIEAFLAWCEIGGMSPKTLLNYEPDLSRGALMFPDKGIAELTGDDLVHIAQAFPPKSRRVRMSTWKSFYKWARRTRRVMVNPCEELPDIKKNHQPVIDIFNEVERDALLGLPVRDAAPIAVLLEAGLRKQEASNLRVQDCLPESGQVIVLQGKGGRDRIVPMSPILSHLLNELLLLERLHPSDHIFYAVKGNQTGTKKIMRDRPVGAATFARWWRARLLAAGVQYRNPHIARHTFATVWRQRGLALDDIQILLGHASINTTQSLYVHTRIQDVAGRMQLIEAGEV